MNVASGFSATGIYPFDPNAIPECAFASSELTRREVAEEISLQPQSASPLLPHQPIQDKTTRKRVSKQRQSDNSSDSFSLHDESSDCPPEFSNEGERLDISFKDILQNPEAKEQNKNKQRKALNYQAIEVIRALFRDKDNAKSVKAAKGQTEVCKNKKKSNNNE